MIRCEKFDVHFTVCMCHIVHASNTDYPPAGWV